MRTALSMSNSREKGEIRNQKCESSPRKLGRPGICIRLINDTSFSIIDIVVDRVRAPSIPRSLDFVRAVLARRQRPRTRGLSNRRAVVLRGSHGRALKNH